MTRNKYMILLLIPLMLIGCKPSDESAKLEIKNVSELDNLPQYVFPIESAEEAIAFAYKANNTQENLIAQEKTYLQLSGWKINAKRKWQGDADYWLVIFNSQGVAPAYSCNILFYPDGTLAGGELTKEVYIPGCEWKK